MFLRLKSNNLLTLWGQMGGGELKDFSGVWLGFYKKNTLSGTCFQWRTFPSKSSVTEAEAYFLPPAISISAIHFRGVKQLSLFLTNPRPQLFVDSHILNLYLDSISLFFVMWEYGCILFLLASVAFSLSLQQDYKSFFVRRFHWTYVPTFGHAPDCSFWR